jgi:hypothetical protein
MDKSIIIGAGVNVCVSRFCMGITRLLQMGDSICRGLGVQIDVEIMSR